MPFTQVLHAFIRYLTCERGLSQNSIEAYSRDLLHFFRFLQNREINSIGALFTPPDESHPAAVVGVDAVIDFLATLQNQQYASSSVARALIALKVFFRFLKREEMCEQDIGLLLDTPKLWQTLPDILSFSEVEVLLARPDRTTGRGVRDRAILELLYATGIRVSELCGLEIYDVSDDEIRVFGKGSKERIVPVSARAVKAVDSYLTEVRDLFDSQAEQKLFLSMKGKPITRTTIWRMVKCYAKEAEITKNIFPHMLRHSFASHLLDGGADLRIIQEMLGHSHISSTDRYTHVSLSKLQQMFTSLHPRW